MCIKRHLRPQNNGVSRGFSATADFLELIALRQTGRCRFREVE